ncbi:MAG: adenylate/guanylate cyclase domain-containing protein, partial [Actinomycetota bacterium]
MSSCSSCGFQIGHDARFCPQCGASQSLAGEERRIVTVLFADIAGFTALAERRDPEEVKHLVDRAFERLARDITAFGGMIDKVLGDGIIALFGAPIAHEDDAERAVRAGLRMQQTVAGLSQELQPPIAVRIGINTGEVLVGGSAAGGDYTAMGDVVNSADRLQKLAEPGQTLVGAPTKWATGDAITFEFAGDLPTRGRERPLEAWLALEPVRPPGQHRQRASAFIGRRHEMALLQAQARLAVDGHRAQLAMVVGEAGIGKTRLAHEAASAIAEQAGARVLEGRCLPYGEANVWWAVADLIRDLYDLRLDAPVDETEVVVRKGLRNQLGDDVERIDRLTVALLHTLGYDTPLRGGDRSRNRSEVTLAVTTVLELELQRRPMVVLLSDMHWATTAVWVLCRNLLGDLARE